MLPKHMLQLIWTLLTCRETLWHVCLGTFLHETLGPSLPGLSGDSVAACKWLCFGAHLHYDDYDHLTLIRINRFTLLLVHSVANLRKEKTRRLRRMMLGMRMATCSFTAVQTFSSEVSHFSLYLVSHLCSDSEVELLLQTSTGICLQICFGSTRHCCKV